MKRPQQRRLKAVESSPPPRRRLEGDHLFAWAKLTSAVDQAMGQARTFALTIGPQYGMNPQTEAIDDNGYIVPIQGNQGGEQPMAPESPLGASTTPIPPLMTPDTVGRA